MPGGQLWEPENQRDMHELYGRGAAVSRGTRGKSELASGSHRPALCRVSVQPTGAA